MSNPDTTTVKCFISNCTEIVEVPSDWVRPRHTIACPACDARICAALMGEARKIADEYQAKADALEGELERLNAQP